MSNQHLIHRCHWQTEFDAQSRAVGLQDSISTWSSSVMQHELDIYFDQVCPSTQTWRIEQLHLDLGEISDDKLAEELPLRLRASLAKEFARIQYQMHEAYREHVEVQEIVGDPDTLELLSTFLYTGTMPWLYRGNQEVLQLWDKQLHSSAQSCIDLIRQSGTDMRVCQRLVLQWDDDRLRTLVCLLEPWQGEKLCRFVDELLLLATLCEEQIAQPVTWQRAIWCGMLRYVLVDCGRLLHTVEFVRAMLRYLRQQVGISEQDLCKRLDIAFFKARATSGIHTPYAVALQTLCHHGHSHNRDVDQHDLPDLWHLLQSMLQHAQDQIQYRNDVLTFAELFALLASEDPARMKTLLEKKSLVSEVRRSILQLLEQTQWELLIRVLVPGSHQLLLDHLDQTATALQQVGDDQAQHHAWEIVLDYVMRHSSMGIELRELVTNTVSNVATISQINRQHTLDLLLHAAQKSRASSQQLTLIPIYLSLHRAYSKPTRYAQHAMVVEQVYIVRLQHYLEHGQDVSQAGLPASAILRKLLADRSMAILKDVLQSIATHAGANLVCQRLLVLAGPANVGTLFEALQTGSGIFCTDLLTVLQQWHNASRLNTLARIDFGIQLPSLMLEALPIMRASSRSTSETTFNHSRFWLALIILVGRAGVDLPVLAQQIRSILAASDGLHSELLVGLSRVLHRAKTFQAARPVPPYSNQSFVQDSLGHYLRDPQFISLARQLLTDGKVPIVDIDVPQLWLDLCNRDPALLRQILEPNHTDLKVMFRLQRWVPFAMLINAMQTDTPQHQSAIDLIHALHQAVAQIRLTAINAQQTGSTLYALVLSHWLKGDWRALDIIDLVTEFAVELLRQFQVPAAQLSAAFSPVLAGKSQALQRAVKVLRKIDALVKTEKIAVPDLHLRKPKIDPRFARPVHTALETMIINNAGLVLLHGFFETLFSRLGLMEQGRFHDLSSQRRAVHILQFLVTGRQRTPEHYLTFNKVLCGLPLETPLELEIEMRADEVDLCKSMLHSVIAHWSANGSHSLDGFRGNWLVRDASLSEVADRWELTVDKRAYDVLLQRAPFSYSLIRLQWMEKTLYVTWPT